jgi:hypothetical protein
MTQSRKERMAGRFRNIFRMSFAWAGVWALLGLLVGITLMLSKYPLIAEPGPRPHDLSDYAFWVPLTSVGLGLFGFALGFLFSSLMALTERWRAPIEARPGLLAKYGPRLLCGAVAGGLICLSITRDGSALFILVACGFFSAAVSSFRNRRRLA